MPPGAGTSRGEGMPPYHSLDVSIRRAPPPPTPAPFAALLAKMTNSDGLDHRPNADSAGDAIARTSGTGLLPRHWLQHRWAARTFAGSTALPPLDMGTSSSSSIEYGWRAG